MCSKKGHRKKLCRSSRNVNEVLSDNDMEGLFLGGVPVDAVEASNFRENDSPMAPEWVSAKFQTFKI